MKKTFLFILCLIINLNTYAQTNKALEKKLTKEIQDLFINNELVGASVAIFNDKETLYTKGFGYLDKASNKKYTNHTIQNIGSISKTFIGLALLKAQEMGKLNLDDPINNHLPFEVINPYYPKDTITIRQIASHTSSIRDRDIWYGMHCYILKEQKIKQQKRKIWFSKPSKMMTLNTLFYNYLNTKEKSYKKKNFSKNRPGKNHEYSNIAAALGAYILEQATGEDFKSFTQKHIFNPLKMDNTGWSFKDVNMEKHSKLYNKSQKELALYSLVTFPDGGLITSSADMSKYGSELIKGFHGQGTILMPKSYKEAFTKTLNNSHFKTEIKDNYGVFFELTKKNNIGHSGGDPSIVTLLYFNPSKKVGKYLQINTELKKKGIMDLLAIWGKLKEHENLFQ